MQKRFPIPHLLLVMLALGLSACTVVMQPVVITATPAPTDTPTVTPTATHTAMPSPTPSPTPTASPTPTPSNTPTPTLALPAGWRTPIPVPSETIAPENVDRLTLLARFNGTLAKEMSNMSFASKKKFLSDKRITLTDWMVMRGWEEKTLAVCAIPDDACEHVPLPDGADVLNAWKGLPSESLYLVVQYGNRVSVQREDGSELYSFGIGGRGWVSDGYVFEDYGFALYETQKGMSVTTHLRNLHTGKTLRLEGSIGYYEPSYADGIVAWTNGTLYVLDLNKNGAIVTRVKWVDGNWGQVAGHPVVFPGGEKVAYVLDRKGKLSLRIIDPQHAHVLTDLGDAYETVMDVSPDGRLLLAYSSDQRVHLVDAETGASLALVPFVSSDFRKFGYFSPDGRYVILPGASTVDVYGIWP